MPELPVTCYVVCYMLHVTCYMLYVIWYVTCYMLRYEIGLPSAEAKTNELIAKHVHTTGFALVCQCTCIM